MTQPRLRSSRANTIACLIAGLVSGSAAHAGVTATSLHEIDQPNQKPQIVLISFDGAGPIDLWQRSRAMAKANDAHFTYFLSCVFLLTRDSRSAYGAPGANGPKSNIGYAASKDEIAQRFDQMLGATEEGHEIASHGCGHLEGGAWTAADWQQELSGFRHILAQAWTLNGIENEPEGWKALTDGIVGFRAPYLSFKPELYDGLRQTDFRYDASITSDGPAFPAQKDGLVHFALPMIPEGPRGRPVIAMDYNLYARQSGAKEDAARASEYEERSYDAFRAAFQHQLDGKRIPLQIGFHFNLMNDGAYWRALERFVGEFCPMADVKCITYRDYLTEVEKADH